MKTLFAALGIVASMGSVTALNAEPFDITVLNAGSKTGSFAQQSIAYSQDLEKLGYSVTLDVPDNHCIGVNKSKRIQGPILMPWSSDYEAEGRWMNGCVTFDVQPNQVIRYDRNTLQVCTLNGSKQEFNTTSKRVGVTPPKVTKQRAMNVVNEHFNTNHRVIEYNGSGATKTALFNGEVEYAVLSIKHVRDVTAKGATCFYTFGERAAENTESLVEIIGSDYTSVLTVGYDAVWLALNMSDEQISQLSGDIRNLHTNSESFIYQYTDGDRKVTPRWDVTSAEGADMFEQSVKSMNPE